MGCIKLSLITRNQHKFEEAKGILEPFNIELVKEPLSKHEIQSNNLIDIALTAARYAYSIIKKPLVVDDSGLFIEALNGFPGPYSSYVFNTIGYEGILKLMKNLSNRRACFKTALVLILPPLERVFLGETCGSIAMEARGRHGFGFDPIFIPEGSNRTYAEMTIEEKNKVSHRFKAFNAMAQWLTNRLKSQGFTRQE